MANNKATTDIAALQIEIKQLRADFTKIAGTMSELGGDRVADAGQPSIEMVWTEVKRQAEGVSREIEQKPVAAAITAFGAGALLGLLLNRHRG